MFLFDLPDGDYEYDIETYPNMFTLAAMNHVTGHRYYFEISDRRNDIELLCLFIDYCRTRKIRWVGFNNIGFDYPVVHFIYAHRYNRSLGVIDIYNKAMSIIKGGDSSRFAHTVWESDWLIPQVDLFKIHHFDNQARSTSLKVLEFNMRMDNIEDLPFPVGTVLNDEQKEILKTYNFHDVNATRLFYNETLDMIKFREELSIRYDRNFLNHNDTKIGKDYFIMELEKANEGSCYKRVGSKRIIQQTPRDSIALKDVILPYIRFDHPEFNRILQWFNESVITETKGTFADVNCTVNGFKFDFGTGGIHGSVDSQIVYAEDDVILDIDVKSFYPNIAIANNLHPAHLGHLFCVLYKNMYLERVQAQKSGNKAVSDMLKLALNGVYGDSNNEYSPFYDPQYTMAITINGQLLLCMLAEKLLTCDSIQMIQINTDGLTIKMPKYLSEWVKSVCVWWEGSTNLVLEYAEYSRMFIRDVNNYIAEYTDGKLKRKGAYEYDLKWYQNHSAVVVPKAAEAALVHGIDISEFIMSHDDVFDFFLRAKVPRSNILEHGGQQVANIVRYFISASGKKLEKIMPAAGPEGAYKRANNLTDAYFNRVMEEVGDAWDARIHTKNKSVYEERRTGINTGWLVEICNTVPTNDITFYDINYQWYIKEAEKLVNLMRD